MKRLVLLLAITGCSGLGDYGVGPDDAGYNGADAQPPCTATITIDPAFPTASSVSPIRASVNIVDQPGVLTYQWSVTHNGNVQYTYEASDQSQIGFLAPTTGVYNISVMIGNAPVGCNRADAPVNVGSPNPHDGLVRLRTVPSPSLAPPQETVIQIQSGADYTRAIALDSGLGVNGLVHTAGGPGVPAYVKLTPIAAPNAFTETFASNAGAFSVRLLGQTHNVLVIPTSTALAPKMIQWTPGMTDFIVGAGTTVNGIVRDPSGSGFGGVKVQLEAGGVPSTVATTAADGSFTLHADFPTGVPITVQATPSAATGLPRVEATGNFDLGQSVQITYSAALQTCNLGGNAVKRSGANQAGAKVTIVGALAGTSGTISTGTPINAVGTVHASATANGSGVLPSTLVPRSNQLSAVISLAANDWALDAVDTSACAAQTIDALPQIARSGVAQNVATTALAGVHIEATPTGMLALGDAEPIVATSGSGGAFSINLAAGATYDVRFTDPLARAAPLPLLNIDPSGVPATATLPKSLVLSGHVSVAGTTNPVVGASVQILCSACSGLESTRPISQTATDSASNYRIAVPDPQ